MAIDAQPRSVSVVVTTRNDRPFIRDCVDSLLRQDVPIDELIVLDCRSTDGTAGAVPTAAGVRLVRDVDPDEALELGRRLAGGDVVCVASGRARYGRGAIRGCLDGAGASGDGLTPVGITSFGRAVAAVALFLPIAPPAIRCWSTADDGWVPARVRGWEYVPSTPQALAAECSRAGARRARGTALPAMLVALAAVAAVRGRGFRRIVIPTAHGVACAVLATGSGKDPAVAPPRALVALEVGHWATGIGFWGGLVTRARWWRTR